MCWNAFQLEILTNFAAVSFYESDAQRLCRELTFRNARSLGPFGISWATEIGDWERI